EAKLANELCPLVDTCDVLLDLHSTSESKQRFIFVDYPTENNRTFAQTLGPDVAIVGWPELYKDLGNEHTSFDTTTYAAHMNKDGLLIECGLHSDPSSTDIAYNSIINTLQHYGLVDGNVKSNELSLIQMQNVFFRKLGEQFAKKWD